MEEQITQTEEVKTEGFMDKVKKVLVKIGSGIKSFVVKTGRANSTNHYGVIENIGDLLVYEDHALISALGMDDVVFTHENVVSYAFDGLGRIRRNKATVQYKIVLDDKVVFPEKVREKNDVQNLTATINIAKETAHLLGNGTMLGADCDVYGYPKCFVIVLNKERQNGDKIEKYQESLLYPYKDVIAIEDHEDKAFLIKFNDKDTVRMWFKPASEQKNQRVLEIREELTKEGIL